MFLYCKKCGFIENCKKPNESCPVCETLMDAVPHEYLTSSGLMFSSKEARKEFEEKIKQGSDYDAEININRDSILKDKQQLKTSEIEKKVEEYKQNQIYIQCPVCKSKSLTKISKVGKVVKVGVFGILGAGDLGKTYKCNSCGYRF